MATAALDHSDRRRCQVAVGPQGPQPGRSTLAQRGGRAGGRGIARGTDLGRHLGAQQRPVRLPGMAQRQVGAWVSWAS